MPGSAEGQPLIRRYFLQLIFRSVYKNARNTDDSTRLCISENFEAAETLLIINLAQPYVKICVYSIY